MKKRIKTCIYVCITTLITAAVLFFIFSVEDFYTNISALSKTAFQAVFSGIITFIGLYFTITFQTSQAIEKKLQDLCPSFIVEEDGVASELKDKHFFENGNSKTYVCSEMTQLRSCVCLIKNTKAIAALNIELLDDSKAVCLTLGSKAAANEKILLVLSGKKQSMFYICFQDSDGNKYTQQIDYKFVENNKYVFISNKPEQQEVII